MDDIKKHMSKIDNFARPVLLYHNKSEKYSSWIGIIATIGLLVTIILS
jgi:hypothetical protein